MLLAIARVNRQYDLGKTYGLIVDCCGITKDLQKALAIFEEEDIKGALEPSDKLNCIGSKNESSIMVIFGRHNNNSNSSRGKRK
jgi:pentatricopeptide repeat protein